LSVRQIIAIAFGAAAVAILAAGLLVWTCRPVMLQAGTSASMSESSSAVDEVDSVQSGEDAASGAHEATPLVSSGGFYADLGSRMVATAGFIVTAVAIFFGFLSLYTLHHAERARTEISGLRSQAEQAVLQTLEAAGDARTEIREMVTNTVARAEAKLGRVEPMLSRVRKITQRLRPIEKTTALYESHLLVDRVVAQAIVNALSSHSGSRRRVLDESQIGEQAKEAFLQLQALEEARLSFAWSARSLTSEDDRTRLQAIHTLGAMVETDANARDLLTELRKAEAFGTKTIEMRAIQEALG